MDLEMLTFRADCLREIRAFFHVRGYLETDTPALASSLIPETCLEVFKTTYLRPAWSASRSENGAGRELYLVPSPEVYLKRIIADHGVSLFQLSKCYRNVESTGNIHSPEFTMLEYYSVGFDYRDSLTLTCELITHLCRTVSGARSAPVSFKEITMDEAFAQAAGFPLSSCPESRDLAYQAERIGLGSLCDYESWAWDDLYELLLVHTVEPWLSSFDAVFLCDYPSRVPCLAEEKGSDWKTKDRWELYMGGVEIANCYSEERNAAAVNRYMREEQSVKGTTALVPHRVIENFGAVCARMPPCSGVAAGIDRLIMRLAGKKTIDAVLPFPLTDSL